MGVGPAISPWETLGKSLYLFELQCNGENGVGK